MAKKEKIVPINVWSINNVNELDLWLVNQEGLKESMNMGQVKELRALMARACFDSANVIKILLLNGEKLHKEGK